MIVIALTFLIIAAFGILSAAIFALWMKLVRQNEAAAARMEKLAASVRALESRIAALAAAVPAAPVAIAPAVAAPVAPASASQKVKDEEITPELLVVLTAAVTVFLGKTVRIRSAKKLQSPYEIVNPWAQQGRVFVQASHNLRAR